MSIFTTTNRKKAFTLVELLVVIAIIGVLVALLLPAVQAAREAARRMSCANNQKQIGLALHNYHDAFKSFPSGSLFTDSLKPWNSQRTTWMMRLLPFVEQTSLYDQVDQSQILGNFGNNTNVQNVKIPTYRCPSDVGKVSSPLDVQYAPTSYVACIGNANSINGGGGDTAVPTPSGLMDKFWASIVQNNGKQKGIFSSNSHTALKDITDGTSNTVAVSECIAGSDILTGSTGGGKFPGEITTCIETTFGTAGTKNDRGYSWFYGIVHTWTFNTLRTPNPDRPDCLSWDVTGNMAARSFHPAGVQVTLCDGSVRFVSDTINQDTWRNLGDKADGKVVAEY